MKRSITIVILSILMILCGCGKQKSAGAAAKPPLSDLIPASKDIPVIIPPQPSAETVSPAETTPIETQPIETQPPLVFDAQLLAKNQYKINIFLSNFAEQGFAVYPADDHALLDFGYEFSKVNKNSVLYTSGEYYCIDRQNMDTILMDYFGRTVTPSDNTVVYQSNGYGGTILYENGTYKFPLADGKMYNYFAVATGMIANDDGTYYVTFDIYYCEGDVEKSYYNMTSQEAEAADNIYCEYSGYAVVRDHTRSSGKESYILISYAMDQ